MIKHHTYLTRLCGVILFCFYSASNIAHASNAIDKQWQFKVYLDGDEIGFHKFAIVHTEEQHEVYSSARFDVKFLFINAYSYRHDNIERWDGHCLNSINATTDDNGEFYKVSGKAVDDAFIINTTEKSSEYSPCIKTFAYWDPEFLKQSQLLNSQTGELIEVSSEFIGNTTTRHKGEDVDARHYRLSGDNLQIDLWYSAEDHWLALESLTENGNVVRYEIP